MNATIEPDADHDGFGDETQDACPTSAATALLCACPASGSGCGPLEVPRRPETRITKGPKGKISAHRATFKFKSEPTGAKFECKLDRKKFKSCTSPKSYKGLDAGKHTFRVRAVSASGQLDPSAAKRSFRVEP